MGYTPARIKVSLVTVAPSGTEIEKLQYTLGSLSVQDMSNWEWVLCVPPGVYEQACTVLDDPRVAVVDASTLPNEKSLWTEAAGVARGQYLTLFDMNDQLPVWSLSARLKHLDNTAARWVLGQMADRYLGQTPERREHDWPVGAHDGGGLSLSSGGLLIPAGLVLAERDLWIDASGLVSGLLLDASVLDETSGRVIDDLVYFKCFEVEEDSEEDNSYLFDDLE